MINVQYSLGVAVDAKGCPLDKDGDGVPVIFDKVPDLFGQSISTGCLTKMVRRCR